MNGNLRLLNKLERKKENRHAVILAGGDGTRLRALTRAIAGDERPKQFCPIFGDESLLERTRKRSAIEIPSENTHFSFTRKHEEYYGYLRSTVPTSHLVVQPENRGTAPAILYSLMRLARIAPDASVAFFPSDHYFSNEKVFMEHVDGAFAAVDLNPSSVVLLGIEPETAETSYGWIEPTQSLFGDLSRAVSRVGRFWEKPTAGVANHLYSSGCLWNSFVMVGRVDTFIQMFRTTSPDLVRIFDAASRVFGTHQEEAVIRSVYSWIKETNFSSEVLEKCSDQLLVMRVGDVGWCDWGDPDRVLGTLNTLGIQPQWLQAMAA